MQKLKLTFARLFATRRAEEAWGRRGMESAVTRLKSGKDQASELGPGT
jgi:hypothetical protein